MTRIRSVDFLPEIFQTDVNKQFLAATLDQLVQEPKFKKTQGFIGRTVGPGVNPNDRYVIEPNRVRADYQLEAGVVSLEPETGKIKDAITYPGLLDSIAYQTADTALTSGVISAEDGDSIRPDRLFKSQYYTWDPFINWDAFINFSQYFWLPNGPDAVDVAATTVPASDDFTVTRNSADYTFSGIIGTNPTIDLVRGGSYTFAVAQNQKQTINYRVSNNGNTAYVINQADNPTISLVRGNTYTFTLNLTGPYPFYIKSQPTTGLTNIYSSGVTNNGAITGTVTFVVPQNAPDVLYYTASNQTNMQGQFNVIDASSGTGSGFWIQTAPGVSGKVPTTPNISSRNVLGVTNNGEDLGTITFNVPSKTAQQFYYNLANVGGGSSPYNVDLVTELKFNQINGIKVADFLAAYGGIDGITQLNGRSLIFDQPIVDAQQGGWYTSPTYNPLNVVPLAERYGVWRINYVLVGSDLTIQLVSILQVNNLEKCSIIYGTTYASTGWYKNDAGIWRQIPLLSAIQDVLYYQDGTNPEIFGRINLLPEPLSSTLFIDDIVGKKTYTSKNGVEFTNGLKIVIRGQVEPASYANQEYYVAGVGTAIELLPVTNFVVPETYVIDANDSTAFVEPAELDYLTINRASKDLNAWTRSNRWFHIDVINATADYNNTTALIDNSYRAKRPIIEFRPGLRLFNMGTEGKQPVDIIDFAETDAFSNIQGATSYSVDGYNFVGGSRVIFAADEDANVKNKIWVVNFVEPDATVLTDADDLLIGYLYTIVSLGTTDWNAIAGTNSVSYSVGDQILVKFAGSGTGTANFSQPIINLTLASDGLVLLDQSTVCTQGETLKGITFWYDGVEWIRAQQKQGVQQAPLYDVYNANGISLSNLISYPSSTFVGSKLFSYAVGDTGILDPILQFPLQYLNLNNVGDIVFENNLYKDSFLYVQDNVSITQPISLGFVREYVNRTLFTREIGWDNAATDTLIRQQFKFTYDGQPLKLDIKVEVLPVDTSTNVVPEIPAVKVYVGSVFKDPSTYSVATTDNTTTITLDETYIIGDVIEVLALSSQSSRVAFYQVPINLENNPLNGNSDSFTLGTIRTHYESICENLTTVSGPINGANNTRDLGNIGPYGLIILQQSAPLTLTGYFNRSQEYNIFASLQYNSREYTKFKNLLMQQVTELEINFQTTAELLTEAMTNLTAGRIETSPFYWSDMLPAGQWTYQTVNTVTLITTNVFDTFLVHSYTSANYFGLNVYKNNQLLIRGVDYVVATDGPRITVTAPLAVGDQITIQEFVATYGSFVPNTPTKMGLYPAWIPAITTVDTSTGTAQVIVGHDGSQTPIYGDVRDDVLLEFEKRIYNNLKLDGNPVPLTVTDVLPGQFRTTGFTFSEINQLLAADFLSYVGWNKLDYNDQNYIANNEFTWNYSNATNKLSGDNLLGAWRGIYRYFYDTQDPARTPWEMLGFSIKPTWWNTVYGPAPYTNANLVLWDDLEAGLVRDPAGSYVKPAYARPGLTDVIPVDSQGNLLSPFDCVVADYNDQLWQRSWTAGDGGPVEASWWNSSSYPFAVMRLLALTRPAKFYSLFADRDEYRYNDEFNQFLFNNRYRLDANGITVYGNGVSKASFINWIVDYNRQLGLDSTADLQADLANLDVRLCYRMASFSDKQYIKLYTEKSSPNSLNTTLLIPDESYDLLLYKNQPFERLNYSAVVVQLVEGGYAVYGYSTAQPFFNILVSQGIGRLRTITVGETSVKVPTQYTNQVSQVPYGFVFTNPTSVCDFLLSYGKLLEEQGLTFTDRANGFILDWDQMAQEFLYWTQQGWEIDSLIALNPLAGKMNITKADAVADSVLTQTNENILLNQNKRELNARNLNIVRLGNTLSIEPLTDESLSYADVRFTSYEHMIVLSNKSVFGDLIYEPVTGARQSRLNLVATTSTDWNGVVDAQGFILNQDNVEEWTGLKKYTKGQIVKYKDQFWSAQTIVNPKPNFDFNDWVKSDYEQIEQGLLPNIANKAEQLQQTYSVTVANLEQDQDLLSYGLIGFRPRQYMAALNLDDVSQVNVYQQFLKSKGTVLSAELLSRINLGKEAADYDIYENWAVQRAVYGANANRSFVELRLNRALLSANPSLVQVIRPEQVSQADQQILLSNIWRQSYKLTSPDFLPTTNVSITDTALPSAGYVSLDDVDLTVFSLATDEDSINAALDNVKVGASIWVAKVNNYDWNVYRCVQLPGYIDHVCDNLDGTSIAYFTQAHGLVVGDQIIIRYLNPDINGTYEVLDTPDINAVTIGYIFVGPQSVIEGVGIAFNLQTQRVSQPSDIVNLPYADDITTGNKVWVDNNGYGNWQVLQKQNPFVDVTELAPQLLDATEEYGVSVSQAKNQLAALIGSPRYGFSTGTEKGGVYVYVKNADAQYMPVSPAGAVDSVLTLNVTGARGYGNAVDFGNATWAVAGASASLGAASEANVGYAAVIYRNPTLGQPGQNPYEQWQLLVPEDLDTNGEFGYSVAMSNDERWMYIGAPGANKVYAYGRVDWQDQVLQVVANGTTSSYNIDDTIQINAATQIVVTLNGTPQTLNTDYTVALDFKSVTFTTVPAENVVVKIQRINRQLLDGGTYYQITGTSGSGSGAEFTITRLRNTLSLVGLTSGGSGYPVSTTVAITINQNDFGGAGAGSSALVVTVNTNAAGQAESIVGYTWTPPSALVSTFSLNEYFFTATNIYSFSVYVDGDLQRPQIDYDFGTDSSYDLTFINVPIAGAAIEVQAQSYFEYVDTLTVAGLDNNARFGHSLTTSTDGRQVVVGTPYRTVNSKVEAGSVYVFDRNVQRFIYGTDPSSVSFTVLGTVTAPVSVIVNNEFLINETDSIVNAPGTFNVSGNTVTVNTDLAVGDTVEIETNQFALVQTIAQNTVAEFVNFGQAVDLCYYNCSLYVGAPQDSTTTWKAGAVQRNVNQSRSYGTITATVANPSLIVGDTLRINNIDVAVPPAGTLTSFATAINTEVPNVIASVSNGFLTLAVKNASAASITDLLQVAPGSIGSAFDSLGFVTFTYAQTLYSPYPTEFAQFGYSVSIDETAVNLVVGSPQGTLWLLAIWDDGLVDWDGNSTTFFSTVVQSGSVYTYDYLRAANESAANTGKFVFGVQISDSNVRPLDRFGAAVSYVDGVLMLGAPGSDAVSSDSTAADYGRVFVTQNPSRTPAWRPLREQLPVVDVGLINGVFTYDRITSARTEQFDFFDPLQGKILGAARQNIDYIGAVDPAQYDNGPTLNNGTTWFAEHVGEIWWNTSTVRFIDPNQDDIVYASRRWGQLFPGSQIDVYQWIESSQPPANYTGPGIPLNIFSYSVASRLSVDGTINAFYYFWVKDLTTVATNKAKTLSTTTVSRYIENPKSSGIPYIATINASTIALYNATSIIEAEDTIINIEYDREYTNNNVHVEYELIAQDKADAFLSNGLYRKLQDSFCGVDTSGNLVPDPNLNAAERYGVQFRPRQSMFVDRFEALKNYLERANAVLVRYPISESRSFQLLNSADPIPAANQLYMAGNFSVGNRYTITTIGTTDFTAIGAASNTPGLSFVATGIGTGTGTATFTNWNLEVANLEILSFQEPIWSNPSGPIPIGYRYLVESDSSNNGLWTIYEVIVSGSVRRLVLVKVQNYDTSRYWYYLDWYLPGYNPSTKIVTEVPNYSALNTLSLPVGTSVGVRANAQGKWEIYVKSITGWDRVGLQDGTIAFSAELWDYALGRFGFDVEVFDAQYFDQEPVIETRKIIQAINEELFIDDLALERNRSLTLMFNYVLSEFAAPEWLVKTSLIDVDHRIRNLEPFQNYRQDNQEFVLDYIQEVKPYHVQIREFNLLYNGQDQYAGDVTDFDVPAYYNTSLPLPQYTSPILLPYAHSTPEPDNTLSDTDSGALIWQAWPYTQWYQNFLLTLDSIKVTHGGSGYTDIPTVIITGDAAVPATAQAFLSSFGSIASIAIVNPGSGYQSTPTITFSGGGGGTGAAAYAVMGNDLVRSFKTIIKYDRCSYQTQILTWSPDGTYEDGTLVRYEDRVWRAASQDSSAVIGPSFDLADWQLVPASELGGIDRTAGYYVPGVNEPGLDLPLLIDGLDYPGVQVYGKNFDSPEPLDVEYSSSFTDLYLGTRFTDINVDGGEFIGLVEGHAPEELVNGSEFDTVDIRVYTRPGSDWSLYDGVAGADGHGFQIVSVRYTVTDVANAVIDWDGIEEHPVYFNVANVTSGLNLNLGTDYTVDWVAKTITVTNNISVNDVISVSAYELGGGSQLYRANALGDNEDYVIVPVQASEIYDVILFVNGSLTPVINWTAYYPSPVWNQFVAYNRLDVVNYTGPAYYRAIQNVPAGIDISNTDYWQVFVPGQLSKVTLPAAYSPSDYLTFVVLGTTTPLQYSWSTPQTEYFIVDAAINASRTVNLSNFVGGTNACNAIVEIDGLRLRPSEGAEYIGDATSTDFALPTRGGYFQNIVNAPTDVTVYVNNVLQQQNIGFGGTYTVSNYNGVSNDRKVVFAVPPAAGDRILVAVSTVAAYLIVGNQLQLVNAPTIGATIAVTTFNDTSQQNIVTLVFQGPEDAGVTITEPYDTVSYDQGNVTNDPGSYDYSSGATIYINNINLQRADISGNRLWVTLNGYRLFDGVDFTLLGQYLILSSGALLPSDILVITQFTESVVPEAMAFRIFQDMRGVQATYRMTPATTTFLAANVAANADIIYVNNAGALTEPDLPNGVFGVCTINGERIMYRNRNTALNTISGLMRGTAGTGATSHSAGAVVYDMGRGNLLYNEYQDSVVKDTSVGDGSTTIFYAPNIDAVPEYPRDSSTAYIDHSIEVYVGGIRQYPITELETPSQYRYTVYTVDPLSIEFIGQAPAAGVEVSVVQRVGKSWYNQGTVQSVTDVVIGNSYFIASLGNTNWLAIGAEEARIGVLFTANAVGTGTGFVTTASDGFALQETDTQAARFLRGL